MKAKIELQPIFGALPQDFGILRAEAKEEGFRFVERLAAEWEAGQNRFDRDGEALLCARVDGIVAGIGGVTVDPVLPGALRMRRFYIRVPFRRHGIGRMLATALLDGARRSGRPIVVNAGTADAPAFWEALGFLPDRRDGHTHRIR